MDKYIPVSCDFYDQLEEDVILGKKGELALPEGEQLTREKARLVNLFSRDGEEFLEYVSMESHATKKVRLDHVKGFEVTAS